MDARHKKLIRWGVHHKKFSQATGNPLGKRKPNCLVELDHWSNRVQNKSAFGRKIGWALAALFVLSWICDVE